MYIIISIGRIRYKVFPAPAITDAAGKYLAAVRDRQTNLVGSHVAAELFNNNTVLIFCCLYFVFLLM